MCNDMYLQDNPWNVSLAIIFLIFYWFSDRCVCYLKGCSWSSIHVMWNHTFIARLKSYYPTRLNERNIQYVLEKYHEEMKEHMDPHTQNVSYPWTFNRLGYFSNSTGSSATNRRFCPSSGGDRSRVSKTIPGNHLRLMACYTSQGKEASWVD